MFDKFSVSGGIETNQLDDNWKPDGPRRQASTSIKSIAGEPGLYWMTRGKAGACCLRWKKSEWIKIYILTPSESKMSAFAWIRHGTLYCQSSKCRKTTDMFRLTTLNRPRQSHNCARMGKSKKLTGTTLCEGQHSVNIHSSRENKIHVVIKRF